MKKNLVLIIFLSVLIMSCGTKKSANNAKKYKPKVVRKSGKQKVNKRLFRTNDDPYPLPEDTGVFMTFTVHSTEEYIETFKDIAMKEMKAYGIPASITIAQGILESGSGQSQLAKRSNNHFGIKCHSGWIGPSVRHDDDAPKECFRKYNHPLYSFRDHSTFLAKRSRYQFLFNFRKDNYKGWAKGLKEAGYATDRKYPQKLIKIIEKYQLYKLDREVLREGYQVKKEKDAPIYVSHNVEAGETLYAISRKYSVSVASIKSINGLENDIISIGQVLIIKKTVAKK